MKINTLLALDTRVFTWDKETSTMSAEASDFGSTMRVGYQLYDDACDFGIHLKSHRTGRVEPFYLHDTKLDPDGDVLYWEFRGCGVGGTGPNMVRVLIFND